MRCLLITFAVVAMVSPAAAGHAAEKQDKSFTLEPTLLKSDDNETTVGLAYKFRYNFNASQEGKPVSLYEPEEPVSRFEALIEGSGVITESAKDNPENFLKTTVKAEYLYQSGGAKGSFKWLAAAGAFASLEADQSFDNQHTVVGFTGFFSALLPQANSDFSIEATYGEVEPGDDIARKAALRTTTLRNYDRYSIEASYQFQTGIALFPDIELDYRWFRESNAPAAIKAARLDKFDLLTVRLGVMENFFVAYSDGKLPFDRENDRTFKAGFSYELGEVGKLLTGLGGALQGVSQD